jgi:hypothetical protein
MEFENRMNMLIEYYNSFKDIEEPYEFNKQQSCFINTEAETKYKYNEDYNQSELINVNESKKTKSNIYKSKPCKNLEKLFNQKKK